MEGQKTRNGVMRGGELVRMLMDGEADSMLVY